MFGDIEMDKHEKNIKSLLEKFLNQDHKKKAIEYWNIRRQIDKINTATQQTDIVSLYHLSKFLRNKSYKDATQKDMMGWEQWLKDQNYTESSIFLYESKIRRFYKFITKPEQYKKGKRFQKNIEFPDNVIWMAATSNNKEFPIDNILTEQEIKKLLDACKDTREQVIVVSLLDGGLRVSELLSLKIKNVGFDKQLGAYFILPKKAMGLKTGQRKIQLFLIPSGTQYIKQYLNQHLNKNNPEAYFIYSDSNYKRGENDATKSMVSSSLWKIVKRIVNKSKIKKEIHPHTLRHISATFCSMKGFNEAMMRERFGWSRSSDMPSHYTHLASKDSSDYIKKILGITEPDTPEESILQPILCPNCEYENVPTNIVCGRCGMKLNIKAEDLTMTATETGLNIQDMIKDPEFMMKIMNMLAEEWKKLQDEKKK